MATQKSQLILSMVDKVTAPARGINRAVEGMQNRIRANNERLDQMRTQVMGAAAAGFALYKGLSAPLNAASEFQEQMSNVSTLVDTSTESMKAMGNEVLAISRRVPVALGDLTSSLYDIRSAGIKAADAMSVLEKSARLAVAGLGSTSQAVDLVTSSINAFNLEGKEQERIYDTIFKAVKHGKTTIAGLKQGFGAVAGTVANANVKIDEYFAAVSAVTTTGAPAAQAHTQIRAAISGLTRETKQSTKVFHALGVDTFKELVTKSGSMVNAFSLIREQLGDDDAALLKLVGSTEALNAVISLTGEQNKAYVVTLDDMRNGANAVDKAFAKQNKTFAAMKQRFANMMKSILIPIGRALIPAFEKIVEVMTPVLERIGELARKFPGATRAIIGVAASLIGLKVAFVALKFAMLWMKGGALLAGLGGLRALQAVVLPLTWALTALVNPLKLVRGAMIALRVAFLATGIGAVIAAIALGGLWIYKNWKGVTAAFDGFKKTLGKALKPVKKTLEPMIEWFKSLYEWVVGLVEPAEDAERSFRNFGRSLGTSVGNAIRTVVDGLRHFPRTMRELPGRIMGWLRGVNWSAVGDEAMRLLKAGLDLAWQGVKFAWDWAKTIGDSLQQSEIVQSLRAKFDSIDWERVLSTVSTGLATGLKIALIGAFKTISLSADIFNWLATQLNQVDAGKVGKVFAGMVVSGVSTAFGLIRAALRGEGGGSGIVEAIGNVLKGGGRLIAAIVRGWFTFAYSFWSSVLQSSIDAIVRKFGEIDLVQVGKDIMNSLWDGMKSIGASITNWAANLGSRIASSITGAVKGLVGMSDAAAKPGKDIQKRARGGPVAAMQPYITGEHGKELFVSRVPGHIFNARQTARMLSGLRSNIAVPQPPAAPRAMASYSAGVSGRGDGSRTVNINVGDIVVQGGANVSAEEVGDAVLDRLRRETWDSRSTIHGDVY